MSFEELILEEDDEFGDLDSAEHLGSGEWRAGYYFPS